MGQAKSDWIVVFDASTSGTRPTDDASLMPFKETLEDGKGIDGRPRTAYEGQRGHYKLELPST